MRQKSVPGKEPATHVVKNIRRATRRYFSAEDKIRIVLEGLRDEDSIAELCRREGIVQNLYYRWSKDVLEAGKKRLAGDTAQAAWPSYPCMEGLDAPIPGAPGTTQSIEPAGLSVSASARSTGALKLPFQDDPTVDPNTADLWN